MLEKRECGEIRSACGEKVNKKRARNEERKSGQQGLGGAPSRDIQADWRDTLERIRARSVLFAVPRALRKQFHSILPVLER